ncbi:MAG: hypothetical protein Tp156SUR915002_2 [Prokaryotic dsDNA virus sp.]|jgi:hypothetical protein|nr:MAG: hypothetical protein Tp162SUR384061_11 [Prokaryotic dsDNA virus sp.]QDP59741.1 MAG: hypothetical protein Tp156SUR915002_2 [Prokaryotic dsDNA virus sp.]|tara:strand:- start:30176 stop:30496 length:321 start_codon:yes stop_codon:yes gene_type:complete
MALKTIEEFRIEATSEIEARKPMKAQVNDETREFTDAEYDQAIEDLAQTKLDEQNNGYARARQESYPALPEQLDMLFHDMTAGKGDKTGEWYKALKKVKDDNPKPS